MQLDCCRCKHVLHSTPGPFLSVKLYRHVHKAPGNFGLIAQRADTCMWCSLPHLFAPHPLTISGALTCNHSGGKGLAMTVWTSNSQWIYRIVSFRSNSVHFHAGMEKNNQKHNISIFHFVWQAGLRVLVLLNILCYNFWIIVSFPKHLCASTVS